MVITIVCSRKRGAIRFGNLLTAMSSDFIKYYFHDGLYLIIKSDTNFPEINAGGTPGPGTVN